MFEALEIFEAFAEAASLRQERKFLWSEGFVVRKHPGGKMLPARMACPDGHDPKLGRRRRDGYFYCLGCERTARAVREERVPPTPRVFAERACDVCLAVFVPTASDRRQTCSERCRRSLTSVRRHEGRSPMISKARLLRDQGLSLREIAREIGSSAPAVCRMLRAP